MNKARLTDDMLRRVPRDQEVISYSVGMDEKGRSLSIKTVAANGREEVLMLAPAIVFHLHRTLHNAIGRLAYRENRVKTKLFLERQPDFVDADRDGKSPHVFIPSGCEVHAYRDALFLGLLVDEQKSIYKIVRFNVGAIRPLNNYLEDALKSGRLIDLENAPSPSTQKN